MPFKPSASSAHVALWSAFPDVTLYIHNAGEAILTDALVALGVSVLFGLLVYLVAGWIFGRTPFITALTLIAVTAILNYGHVRELCAIIGHAFGYYSDIRNRHSFLVLCAMTLVPSFLAFLLRRKPDTLTKWLNVASHALLAVMLVKIVMNLFTSGSSGTVKTPPVFEVADIPLERMQSGAMQRPDIYYLIFDRYAHHKELKNSLGFDNSEFLAFLREHGFVIPPVAFANFYGSTLSLTSSLNMQYLHFIPEQVGEDSPSIKASYDAIHNHESFRFLHAAGYTHYHLGNSLTATSFHALADVNKNFSIWSRSRFLDYYFNTTLLNPVLYMFLTLPNVNQVKGFDELARIMEQPGPKYVFAHFLLPHASYNFKADGTLRVRSELDNASTEQYLEQLRFTNTKIKQLIETVEAGSKQPFIMILQSDEGPFVYDVAQNTASSSVRLHGRILNALRLPGVPAEEIEKLQSPVNTFRFIFNHYFNMNLELLEDRSYLSTRMTPFKFEDITDQVDGLDP
jgi:hypothetical protein